MADTFSNLVYHVVFSTKNRLPLISGAVKDRLPAYVGGIVKSIDGTVIAIGGMPDHLHLVVRLPARLSVAEAMRSVKTNTSRLVNVQFGSVKFGWQRGYGAFSVSPSMLEAVVHYVRSQEAHHRRRSFPDEMSLLLRRHGIDAGVAM